MSIKGNVKSRKSMLIAVNDTSQLTYPYMKAPWSRTTQYF